MTTDDNPAHASQEMLQALQQAQQQAAQKRASMAKAPRYQHRPPNFETLCREWLQREVWTLDEAANLLSGYAPDRPIAFGGTEAMRTSLVRADPDRLPIIKRAVSAGNRQFKAADVLAWAQRHDIALPAALGGANDLHDATPTRPAYETPLMRIMYEAIDKFWVDYDPNDPDGRFPKQDAILAWLSGERGLTDSEARAVDLIVRHPSRKRGGQTTPKG